MLSEALEKLWAVIEKPGPVLEVAFTVAVVAMLLLLIFVSLFPDVLDIGADKDNPKKSKCFYHILALSSV